MTYSVSKFRQTINNFATLKPRKNYFLNYKMNRGCLKIYEELKKNKPLRTHSLR